MPRYTIKPGFRHGKNNEYGPGDTVELTEYQAGPLMHKLTPLDTSPADAPPAMGLVPDAPTLEDVFGPDIAERLRDAGLGTVAEVEAELETLEKRAGIGKATAGRVREMLEAYHQAGRGE